MGRHRDLLVALNAELDLSRDAVCRLARDPGAWSSPRAPAPGTARRLGVAAEALSLARGMLPQVAERAAAERRRARRAGATVVTRADADYPAALDDLELPPPVLYVAGRLPRRPGVAIVGSRRADTYGLEVAELFGRRLAERGLAVVSGFARGVDAAAHRGALAARGGTTVAVLGCGLDVDYPRGHRRLGREIALRGARISEFPLGAPPRPFNFPVRNRIIAALSLGVLVVQAARRSGSLITARLALELGRDVWAVPAPIFARRAAGPNSLIRDGALAVQEPRDVIESLPDAVRERLAAAGGAGPPPGATTASGAPGGATGRVLDALEPGAARGADEIASRTGLSAGEVQAALVELELAGLARRRPGPTWSRRLERGGNGG